MFKSAIRHGGILLPLLFNVYFKSHMPSMKIKFFYRLSNFSAVFDVSV